jgi:hypothetical protein
VTKQQSMTAVSEAGATTVGGLTRWEAQLAQGPIAAVDSATLSLRTSISSHRVYELIDGGDAVRVFLEHHVVAVWDFMSLLKALQRALTCVTVPWIPQGDPTQRRFINELVVAEESDLGPGGRYTSHLELYIDAMREARADTGPIDRLLEGVATGDLEAIDRCGLPPGAVAFTRSTLAGIIDQPVHRVAAAFAFGRERVIPAMFTTLRSAAELHKPRLNLLLDYLDRHIDLDAEVHTPLAFGLVAGLCGDDARRWQEAEAAAFAALEGRLELWEAAARAIEASRMAPVGVAAAR